MWNRFKSWYHNTHVRAEYDSMLLRMCDPKRVKIYVNEKDGEAREAVPLYEHQYMEVTDECYRRQYLELLRKYMNDNLGEHNIVTHGPFQYEMRVQGDFPDACSSFFCCLTVNADRTSGPHDLTFTFTKALQGSEYRETIEDMRVRKSSAHSPLYGYTRTIIAQMQPLPNE